MSTTIDTEQHHVEVVMPKTTAFGRYLRGGEVPGRPDLYVTYSADMAMLNTTAKLVGVLVICAIAFVMPLMIEDNLVILLARAFGFAIGAIGLNMLTGYAGQVSLGHAFFVGVGAFLAAALSGDPDDARVLGYGLPMIVWLPASAIVPGLIGALVAPVASRLRGLYLAIVTLGLVFLGEHLFREMKPFTGGPGVGRPGVQAEIFGISIIRDGPSFVEAQKMYWFALVLLIVTAILGRNIARSDVGRAFQAVRDRDIAAEVMGVSLSRYKTLAFVVSSALAGVSGAVLYTINDRILPESFTLLLSVQFIAIILIGGASTISGSIAGSVFLLTVLEGAKEVGRYLPFIPTGNTQGGLINAAQLSQILYGVLIVGFLLFEPRGLFGVWIRIRNYWKGWPFSY